MRRRIIALSFLFLWFDSAGAEVQVKNLRLWHAPDHTRLVFDLSGPVVFRGQIITGPDRVAVDLDGAKLKGALPKLTATGPYLKQVRSGQFTQTVLRLVLDLKRKVSPRIALLEPNRLYGYRLVIDLYQAGTVNVVLSNAKDAVSETGTPAAPSAAPQPPSQPPPPRAPKRSRYFIVAIDAGHGGEDPGAIGRSGTREKNITLKVAQELKRLVDREPKMRAVMIRRGDYFVSLRGRTNLARNSQADVLVSIHADAFPKRSVRGSSVYALSAKGASSEEARWLADKENAADLIGGVSLKDKDDNLAYTLYDLQRTKTIEHSLELGHDVLKELGRVGKLHRGRVEQAGFVVLKSPDVPSILVETAFITNPQEERALRSQRHRARIAQAIFNGLNRYRIRNRLPNVATAAEEFALER